MIIWRGEGRISLSKQTIDLSFIQGDIGISSSLLKEIDDIRVIGSRVISIENLTTFNAYQPKKEFVIYLGGYHNNARREFIKELFRHNPTVQYYHYGDIDAGGFYILNHLRTKTGVPFAPLHMDVQTLKDNADKTKELTENDRKRLANLLDGEFDEVVRYMLEHNCKFEQENLD